MGYGKKCPSGSLPVFSVGSEKEAKTLIVLACRMNLNGEYFAHELAEDQTLDNLEAFSARLDAAHDLVREKGLCTCSDHEVCG